MGKGVAHELIEAAGLIPRIAQFTGRKPDEVLPDAIETYLWVLHEQAFSKKVVSTNGRPEDQMELVDLVRDKQAAQRYFNEIGWE